MSFLTSFQRQSLAKDLSATPLSGSSGARPPPFGDDGPHIRDRPVLRDLIHGLLLSRSGRRPPIASRDEDAGR